MTPQEQALSDHIEKQFTQAACETVIIKAASIYIAEQPPNRDFSAYMLMGMDKVLCRPDETMAGPLERIQWSKWKWLQWATSPSDLTFIGCIRFILSDAEGEDGDDEDCVSLEDVLLVLSGRSHDAMEDPADAQ